MRVEYGTLEQNGVFTPFISVKNIAGEKKEIIFTSNVSFDTTDLARQFCLLMHKVLSGPQPNFKYDRHGNA